MVFKSKRSIENYITLLALAFLISFSPFLFNSGKFFQVLLVLALMYQLWLLKTTYVLNENNLQINYLFIKKSIPYSEIKSFEIGKFYLGKKYATTNNCIKLNCIKQEILISPINENLFMELMNENIQK